MKRRSTITVSRTPTGWYGEFSGPAAAPLPELLGSTRLPLAFGPAVLGALVQAAMERAWPEFDSVEVAA